MSSALREWMLQCVHFRIGMAVLETRCLRHICVFLFGCLAHSNVILFIYWLSQHCHLFLFRYRLSDTVMYFCSGISCLRHTVMLKLWAIWQIISFMTFSTVQKQILKRQENCCSAFCRGIYMKKWPTGTYQLNCWIQRCTCSIVQGMLISP